LPAPSLADALSAGVVVLDGGLATELERRGHDLSSALWSAQLLVDRPAEITAAHRSFREAGAQVATTASYQACLDGFARAGVAGPAMLRRSVTLAQEAMGGDGWVAGSVGPYGAVLADGSEYRGDYGLSVRQLRRFHRPRLEILAEAGADVLALETVPCLTEVEALLGELDVLRVPAWLSLTCAGDRTRAGEPAAAAFAMAADAASLIAVGVNCTDPDDLAALIPVAARSGLPVVAYPNSGERWDAERRAWTGSRHFRAEDVRGWVAAGARLVGGCCRVGPDQIAAIAAAVR
jgi:homocysteine S-methyltransferase